MLVRAMGLYLVVFMGHPFCGGEWLYYVSKNLEWIAVCDNVEIISRACHGILWEGI